MALGTFPSLPAEGDKSVPAPDVLAEGPMAWGFGAGPQGHVPHWLGWGTGARANRGTDGPWGCPEGLC